MPDEVIDLRSDTVTRPTPAMRAAIAAAEVGDDVLGDDPTVKRLEARCAALFDKPAALFVPSGTMANQLAIRSVCEPGDEIIADETVHSYNYEAGGTAALAGCSMRLLSGTRGIFTVADVERSIRPLDPHFPVSKMVIVENTSNRGGGAIWPVATVAEIQRVCSTRGLHLHMDGARLMNACVALGIGPRDYARHVDSLSMCFSKGLGAPVGSVVAGSESFIGRCIRFRKMFGGGMRQAGILAAAALYALDHHVERLAQDHAGARRLAEGIAAIPGIRLDPATVQTNIVIFEIDPSVGTARAFAEALRARGVHLFDTAPTRARAVVHLDIAPEQIDRAIAIFRGVCAHLRRPSAA